jgi:hypothetical protein
LIAEPLTDQVFSTAVMDAADTDCGPGAQDTISDCEPVSRTVELAAIGEIRSFVSSTFISSFEVVVPMRCRGFSLLIGGITQKNPVEIPDNFPIVLGGNPDRLSQQPVRTLICQGAFNNREKKR